MPLWSSRLTCGCAIYGVSHAHIVGSAQSTISGVLCTRALLGHRRPLAQVGRNAKNMNSTTRDVKWHPSTLNPINRWRQGSGLCPLRA